MSWYLANEDGPIDQFASISGLRDLREAAHGPALKKFFDDGETDDVAQCISELAHVEGDADVQATARGLAKLMHGQKSVSITQGFS